MSITLTLANTRHCETSVTIIRNVTVNAGSKLEKKRCELQMYTLRFRSRRKNSRRNIGMTCEIVSARQRNGMVNNIKLLFQMDR